jgi:hypothetical protein
VDYVRYALLTLHILGAAAIIGPAFEQLRAETKRITTVMLWGARAQIVTGLLLVGSVYASDAYEPDNAKLAVKLVIALAVAGLAESQRKKETVTWGFWAVLGLTILNVVVAVFWR